MPVLDLINEVVSVQGLTPQILTASVQGASQDFSDSDFAMNMIVDVSVPTIANVTSLVVQAEESTSGTGNWTVIPGMVVTVTATTAPSNLHQTVRGLRTQQYCRANAVTFSATTATGAFPTSASLIGQRKYQSTVQICTLALQTGPVWGTPLIVSKSAP